jgi:hypothetical protein
MHSPTHRRLRQALRRQRCTGEPRFTRPAFSRRALRSHDHQRAPRKLSVHAVAWCSPCAYHVPYYTAQVLRAETAAYATLARWSTRITLAKRICSRILRIMSPTILPRCHARRPRCTLRSHDCQRISVQSFYLTRSGCVLLSQGGAGVRLRAEAAACATPA